mmetsp:Transcript_52413/g.81748  ORF Transcript_52413/g.81748 Transcript_52413/m.81748 type:complete len:134 (-) Transcript_52413:27-428(-)
MFLPDVVTLLVVVAVDCTDSMFIGVVIGAVVSVAAVVVIDAVFVVGTIVVDGAIVVVGAIEVVGASVVIGVVVVAAIVVVGSTVVVEAIVVGGAVVEHRETPRQFAGRPDRKLASISFVPSLVRGGKLWEGLK